MSSASHRSGPRPGGRSARVQAAVHAAVKQLQAELPSSEITVPAVALRAGVTPSTIYRRWGDLATVLADVAVERLRPDTEPPDTGTFMGDLTAWSEQYLEEMSSPVGRAMIKDVLSAGHQGDEPPAPCRCFAFTQSQLEVMVERARQRGERGLPSPSSLMDHLVAPIIYRLLFAGEAPTVHWLHERLGLMRVAKQASGLAESTFQ